MSRHEFVWRVYFEGDSMLSWPLERRGLVRGRVEASGAPGRAQEPDTWWDLTDEAWDMLGLIRSR